MNCSSRVCMRTSFFLSILIAAGPLLIVGTTPVAIGAGFGVASESPLPSPISQELVCGDLNADGAIDIFDAIIGLQVIVGLVEPTPSIDIAADLNRDGAITVLDIITLLQQIVGLLGGIDDCGPPGPGKIVFTSNRHGNLEIYVMAAEPFATSTRLTFDPGEDMGPAWFPDGQRIAFHGQGLTDPNNSGRFHIFVMDSDGQNLVQLTSGNSNNLRPDIAPDGATIVFRSDRAGRAIFVMDTNGENITQLTDTDGSTDTPSWSPDGSSIAFARNGDIWVMAADGSAQQLVFDDPRSAHSPAWSPDGTMLAYVTDRDTQPGHSEQAIYVTDLGGDVHIRLTDDGFGPAWSPSGDKVVFYRWVVNNWELHQMNSDGSSIEQLTFNPGADLEPDWTP